jgi:hypothetical protein
MNLKFYIMAKKINEKLGKCMYAHVWTGSPCHLTAMMS